MPETQIQKLKRKQNEAQDSIKKLSTQNQRLTAENQRLRERENQGTNRELVQQDVTAAASNDVEIPDVQGLCLSDVDSEFDEDGDPSSRPLRKLTPPPEAT